DLFGCGLGPAFSRAATIRTARIYHAIDVAKLEWGAVERGKLASAPFYLSLMLAERTAVLAADHIIAISRATAEGLAKAHPRGLATDSDDRNASSLRCGLCRRQRDGTVRAVRRTERMGRADATCDDRREPPPEARDPSEGEKRSVPSVQGGAHDRGDLCQATQMRVSEAPAAHPPCGIRAFVQIARM